MIVAGFGFRKSVRLSSLRASLELARQGLPSVDALATPADKGPMLAPLAEAMRLPLIAVTPEALAAVPTLTNSPASLAARGTGSVAEASALAAAGAGAWLVTSRHVSPDRMATCAIARGSTA